jgi:hypothetical protein
MLFLGKWLLMRFDDCFFVVIIVISGNKIKGWEIKKKKFIFFYFFIGWVSGGSPPRV